MGWVANSKPRWCRTKPWTKRCDYTIPAVSTLHWAIVPLKQNAQPGGLTQWQSETGAGNGGLRPSILEQRHVQQLAQRAGAGKKTNHQNITTPANLVAELNRT